MTIQVLTQSRAELIRRTFDAIAGARRAIVHLYNSTSELQRRVVFGQDRAGIIDIAVTGAKLIGDLASAVHDTEIIHQYSPESLCGKYTRSMNGAFNTEDRQGLRLRGG